MKLIQVQTEVDNNNNTLAFAFGWPGACGWGESKETALTKLREDIIWTMHWLENIEDINFELEIVEEIKSTGDPINADSEGFFEHDKIAFSDDEVRKTIDLLNLSRKYLLNITSQINPRKREIRLIEDKRTGNEILDHIAIAEWWYMTRLSLITIGIDDWRKLHTDPLKKLYQVREMSTIFLWNLKSINIESRTTISKPQGEKWTYRKVLRRMVWHELLHAKQLNKLIHKLSRVE